MSASPSLSLEPRSLLVRQDCIKVNQRPGTEISSRRDFKGKTTSRRSWQRARGHQGGEGAGQSPRSQVNPEKRKAAKKLQGRICHQRRQSSRELTALEGQSATISLPDIHLQALGKGPDGITPEELAKLVLEAVEREPPSRGGHPE